MNDPRYQEMLAWLREQGIQDGQVEPASADASFRRYFRVTTDEGTFIVMDAPPEKEDCHPFVNIAEAFIQLGLNVPQIYKKDFDKGFLLLSDLGSTQYLQVLNEETVDQLYGDALGALVSLQACGPGCAILPAYDEKLLLTEMELFREWLLGKHLSLELDAAQNEIIDRAYQLLAKSALQQPQVAVHRDYHSRNLMQTVEHNPGVIDFQDAVIGPLTYDLVSLLRDCYIKWPKARVGEWALAYLDLARQREIVRDVSEEQFLRWFDLMGVQRHLKASGIFARLNYRDNKPGYLDDIPRTLSYIFDVLPTYSDFSEFLGLIRKLIPQELQQE